MKEHHMPDKWERRAAQIVVVTILFGLLAWSNVVFTRGEGRIAAVWLPNAMLLAVLLRGGGKGDLVYFPLAFLANCTANLFAGDDILRASGLSLVNIVEVFVAWIGMIRLGRARPDMSDLKDLIAFVGVAGVLAPIVSGMLAAIILRPGSLHELLSFWWSWSLTDGLGMIIVGPSLMTVCDTFRRRRRPSLGTIAEWIWIVAVGTTTTVLVFWQTTYPFLFLVAPVVMMHAFRLGTFGTAISVAKIAIVASLATALGHGPIQLVQGGIAAKLLALQVFLATIFAMGLPVAAMLAGKKRVERALASHRDNMKSMLENMREIIFRIDATGCWTFLNPAWETITGYRVKDSLGWHTTKLLYPDDKLEAAEFYPKIVSGEIDECLLRQRFYRADGELRDIEVSVRASRDEAGDFTGAIGNIRDVTEQRKAQNSLKESEARFRNLAEAAPLGIYRADSNGMVTYVNAEWAEITGLSPSDALGEGWKAALADRASSLFKPGWEGISYPGMTRKRQIDFRRPDGTIVRATNVSAAEFDADGNPCGFIGVINDVTAELKATEALAAANRVFEDLTNLSPAGIFRTDPDGALTYCNIAWLALSGLTEEAAQGTGWAAALHTEDRQRIWNEWAQAVAKKTSYRGEFRFVRPDGAVCWVVAIAAPECDDTGNIVGFIGVNLDITERKKLEAELVRAKLHAEQAAIAKASFLANMSHEIRTPMNGVLGFADLLLESNLDEEQQKQAQLIADSGRAMMRLLNDILDISKVEAGQMVIACEPVDLRHILKSCVKLMSPNAAQKGLTLDLELEPSIPSRIAGDGLRIRQVLLNLIGNALKFTETGGVCVRATARTADNSQLSVEIAVEDTGIGIPYERQEAVFHPFEQADDTTVRRFGGTGLGLTISRQLAELMGGTMSLDSEPGKGSTFIVHLPTVAAEAPAPSTSEEVVGADADAGVNSMQGHVLLVEDHDVNQMLITTLLERMGCSMELATDGAEAIARIDASRASGGRHFDLVLMDLQMPFVDGYQATRMIRARGIGSDELPIVALTANAYADDIEACLQAGMQDHLAKPIAKNALEQILSKWIKPGARSNTVNVAQKSTNDHLIEARYQQRRQEAFEQIEAFTKLDDYSDKDVEEMIIILHKLAGTAGMFGEPELGECASQFEEGLRSWTVAERALHIREEAVKITRFA
ncbi:MAG: PAS domain S-box protein [Tsuneonella suprasediminis]